ncbi:MAG: hypothetical protein AB1428_11760 [Bacteroidota bacterium]
MKLVAKGLEALGIACMMIGLVQGIFSQTMWTELYLSVFGVLLFLAGRGLERRAARRENPAPPTSTPTHSQ